jgi:hypothetical protein
MRPAGYPACCCPNTRYALSLMANPFSEYGVSDADFEAEMESDEVLKGRIELAEKAAAYWRRASPELTGEYIDSIEVHVKGNDVWVAASDDKANLIEYGTEDTPEFAPRAKTQARFAGDN